MARERETDILFVYVADVNFLGRVPGNIVVDVATELENMGEFLLLMAKERAEAEGVTANTVVKRGEFRTALLDAAREGGASLIVLGSPGENSNITQREYLDQLAKGIAEESGIETIIV